MKQYFNQNKKQEKFRCNLFYEKATIILDNIIHNTLTLTSIRFTKSPNNYLFRGKKKKNPSKKYQTKQI